MMKDKLLTLEINEHRDITFHLCKCVRTIILAGKL